MTRIFIAILLITFPLIQNVALAYSRADCDNLDRDQGMCEENPFCFFQGLNCNVCSDNSVRDPNSNSSPKDTPCITCGDLLDDTNTPYSNFDDTEIEGASNTTFEKEKLQGYCYKECPTMPSCILPSIVPSNAPFDLKEGKAYYGNECDYGDFNCNGNYHANTTTGCCDADIITNVTLTAIQHCTNKKGVKIWQGNDYLTFCTECATGYHLENTKTATTTNGTNITYGICVTNTPLCSTVIKVPCETNGTITGNAQWNTDNGKYDYSACTCDTLTQDELGKCGPVYNTWDGTQWTGSEYKCTECNAGACWWNEDPNKKCAPAQQGYYSPAPDAKCHKCPAGSTTPSNQVGAQSLDECALTPGTTKFCSNNDTNCFTLPTDAKTFPASKTPSTQQ